MKYARMTLGDRYQIKVLIESGMSIRGIAKSLNRSPSTILRELKNFGDKKYQPEKAQAQTRRRRLGIGPKQKIQGDLKLEIDEKLYLDWSPEQIADGLGKISHESIYRYIYRERKAGNNLYVHLRRKRKYRITRGYLKSRKRCGLRVNQTWIEERPKLVDERKRLGDLERDTMIGGSGRLLTIVDRTSRLVRIAKLENFNSSETHYLTLDLLKNETVRTITNDNGPEFGLHTETAKALGIKIYFTRPYCSWQRGTNENTNGLLRQYFPRDLDLSLVTHENLKHAEDRLNNRPRKCLGFKTPNEVHRLLSQGVALSY